MADRKKPATSAAELSVDAVIVGGGLVGLTMACAIGSAGLRIAVLDREDPQTAKAAPYDGRASAIAYGSRRVLEAIGVWQLVGARAEPILDIRVSDGASPLFLHYDHADVGDQPLGHIVENQVLRDALFGRVPALSTISHLAPASLVGIERQPGKVVARLSTGQAVTASVLIAADGRHSAMRRDAGIGVTHVPYKQVGIVCTMAHERPHGGVAHERFLPSGPFAVLPMTDHPEDGHRSSIVWTEREALAPAMLELDDRAFSAELARRFGDWYGEVRIAGGRWSYPLSLTHADRYSAERLALIGDSAHAIHPIAGQGLNLGIRDVAALSEVMVDAARLGLDVGSRAVLDRYQRWRRFDSMALIAVTDGLNRLFSNDIQPVRLVRDVGMAAVNRMPPVKRLLMRHAMGVVGELPRMVRGQAL